ncbi:MAG TPA: hypothetical protein VKT99_05500 [Xanthobacteraceae bacterium]|nr:hypothetical protein [Xanthobacteraceae bacterium]
MDIKKRLNAGQSKSCLLLDEGANGVEYVQARKFPIRIQPEILLAFAPQKADGFEAWQTIETVILHSADARSPAQTILMRRVC